MSGANDATAIEPLRGPVDAVVRVPGSKSLTNRALVIACLARGTTRLSNASPGDDCRDLIRALGALGFTAAAEGTDVAVEGSAGRVPSRHAKLDTGLGGTTTRFAIAVAAAGHGDYLIDAAPRMRERPVSDLLDALEQAGATIESSNGHLPVRVRARGLRGGQMTVGGETSSQFLSALLLVAPTSSAPVEIHLAGLLRSRPYVDMTVAAMAAFGVQVERDGYRFFRVEPSVYRSPSTFAVEGDASSASYFFAIPAITGGHVTVAGIGRASLQGDIRFLDLLEKIGCEVFDKGDRVVVARGPAPVCGIDVDLSDMPDTAQTLAVIAPFASSPTTIRGIGSARLKECDRVKAVCDELSRVGAQVEEFEDGLRIVPGNLLHGGSVRTYDDHRMAMAFSLIGLRVAGIAVENPGCVNKSFPGYFDLLGRLGSGTVQARGSSVRCRD